MASKLGRVSRILGNMEKGAKLIKIFASDMPIKDKLIAGADFYAEFVFVGAGATVGGFTGGLIGTPGGVLAIGGAGAGAIAGGEIMGRAYDKVKEFLKSFGRK